MALVIESGWFETVLWQQVSHLLLRYTKSGYGTVLTAACARQGRSATEWVSNIWVVTDAVGNPTIRYIFIVLVWIHRRYDIALRLLPVAPVWILTDLNFVNQTSVRIPYFPIRVTRTAHLILLHLIFLERTQTVKFLRCRGLIFCYTFPLIWVELQFVPNAPSASTERL
jgi:hypothetical protein